MCIYVLANVHMKNCILIVEVCILTKHQLVYMQTGGPMTNRTKNGMRYML